MTDKKKPRPVPAKKPGASSKSGPTMKEKILAQRKADEAAAAKKTSAKPGARAGAKKASAPRTAAGSGAKPSGAGARRTGGATRPSPSRGKSTRGAADGDGEERSSRRRGREPKKKSPVPFIAAGVLAVGAAAGIYFMNQGDDAEEAPDTTVSAAEKAGGAGEGRRHGRRTC